MGNIVIVVDSGWKNMGTEIRPYLERRFGCIMYRMGDAPSSALPQMDEHDIVWFYSLSSFKRQFKDLIEEYLEEYVCGMGEFERQLYNGVTLEQVAIR